MDHLNSIHADTVSFQRAGTRSLLGGAAHYTQWALMAFMLSVLLVLASCEPEDNSSRGGISGEWLIARGEVRDGGPGKDGIPSIDRPDFAPASETTYIPDLRMVVGVKIGDEVRAYPHQVLDWHEIVNDRIGDTSIALVYCPLTGTGMCWNREIDGDVTEFGVSGLLYRNNLIAYDRKSDSNWSQMQLRGVNGPHISRDAEMFTVVETTWKTWKELYPDSRVHTTSTGHSRNYGGFTYGADFSTNHNSILFPVANSDARLQNKTRVHGIIGGSVNEADTEINVYPIGGFGDGIRLVEDRVGDRDYIIAGSGSYNFAVAFELEAGNTLSLQFEAVQDELPVILQDNEGNKWDVFGFAVEGPRAGEQLKTARAYTGYWYAWADFYPGLGIHEF